MIDGTLVDSLVGGAVTGTLAVATMKIMLDRVFRRQDAGLRLAAVALAVLNRGGTL